ncbi:MAG: thiamine pyrophosphate-binding protein [Pseudomonadota bacterium]|nr:thiamine pyrophosphate-binding protein [Pseudomonadota bacterium]
MRHGGQLLIDQLAEEGCDMAFCVPGESFLAALDGLYGRKDIRTIICRQEGGATMMAEAYAKMTGRPGVCFVTRGPGASNASIGVHIARQDSTPLILFVGQVGRGFRDREAFQEVDMPAMFRPLAKWAATINDTSRIPEYVARAWRIAQTGRPGPVVLDLPEDMLSDLSDAKTIPAAPLPQITPADRHMTAFSDEIARAKKPMMLIGGPGWNSTIREQVTRFAERLDLPVANAFRNSDYIDNRHPNYVGHSGLAYSPKLMARIKAADLVIAVGPRLGEITTDGYSTLTPPHPAQRLVHVHPCGDELGSVYRADVPIQSNLSAFAAQLDQVRAPATIPWRDWRKNARAEYENFLLPDELPGAVKMADVVRHVSQVLPDNAVVTNGAGNYAGFLSRYFIYKEYRTQVANTAGAMGYCVPSAVAGKLAAPDRIVVSFAGDGCFLMNGQELATAMQYDLPMVIIVANNGMYGTIRMHQERNYPERVSGTTLVNPDFAAYARSFGAFGEVVERTEDFPGAFDRALKAGKPALIELKLDPEALTPKLTLSQIRAAGLKDKA